MQHQDGSNHLSRMPTYYWRDIHGQCPHMQDVEDTKSMSFVNISAPAGLGTKSLLATTPFTVLLSSTCCRAACVVQHQNDGFLSREDFSARTCCTVDVSPINGLLVAFKALAYCCAPAPEKTQSPEERARQKPAIMENQLVRGHVGFMCSAHR